MNNTWFWFIQFNLKKQMWVNNCYGKYCSIRKNNKQL